jgi:hypothetical protein
MHKNHRRKNPTHRLGTYKSWLKGAKQWELSQRVRKRRQRDRILLRKTIIDEEAWEEIRKFEKPVDWWAID